MSYLPPVVARLSMDLGDFDAKLDEAKAKIKSLNTTVRIDEKTTGNLKSQASDLEKIAREADRINRAHKATMSLKLADGTKTWEELIAIDREMARLNGKTARMHVKVNKSDLNQAESLLGAVKKLFTGGPDVNLPFTSMGASPMGLAGIAAGITALLPELAGLVSGFSAAGAAAGAFYLLAHPAIKNLQADVQGLSAANQKLHIAQNTYQLDPSKTNLKALTKAQDAYNATLKAAGQDAGPAAAGMLRLREEYLKITTGFKPEAFKVLGGGIKLMADMLPKAVPFANTFADSMSKWLNNLDKASKGQAFQGFLKQFQSISGPALQAITAGIGNVAGSIGRLLTVMSGKDVAHTINIAFSAISGTIGGLTTTIKFLMNAWDGMGLAIDNVKSSLHSVAAAFDTVRHFFAGGGHDIAQDFDQIRHAVATVAHNIASAFDNVRHDIAAKFDGVKAAVVSKFNGAASWLGDKAHSIANAFDHVRHDIAAKFDGVKGFITGKFAGAGSWLVASGKAIMDGLLAGITSAWNKVATFLSSLAGKIKSLKGPLDYDRVMLYPHGQAIMGGLMAGMQSRVPALESQLRGITNDISGIAGNRAALAGGGGEIVNHIHVTLDGREIYSSIQKQAVSTQRRTGQTGLTKRTR